MFLRSCLILFIISVYGVVSETRIEPKSMPDSEDTLSLKKQLESLREDNQNLRKKLETLESRFYIGSNFQTQSTVESKRDDELRRIQNILMASLLKLRNPINEFDETTSSLSESISTSDSTKKLQNYDSHFNCLENCNGTQNLPVNCRDALELEKTGDGIYLLELPNAPIASPYFTYCLQDGNGDNAWIIIQRRQYGTVNFCRNWTDYQYGFGDLSGDYWLGLERLHILTNAEKYELWIQMKDHEGNSRFARYAKFRIDDAAHGYKLRSLGQYTGDAGNSFQFNYDCEFETYDHSNMIENCAGKRMGGWWFPNCKYSNLNGIYNSTDYGTGINWIGWHNYYYSLQYVHMAIRPVPNDLVKIKLVRTVTFYA